MFLLLVAAEFLGLDGLRKVSAQTRRLLREENILYEGRKRKPYRKRRKRKECFGEMVQFDGSYHEWFEGKPKQWLMVMVDDATSTTYAQFYDHEGIEPAMKVLYGWIEQYGSPKTLYCDRKNSYVMPAKRKGKNKDSTLNDFIRTCCEFDIYIISAHSPQAKGRVERMNRTYA